MKRLVATNSCKLTSEMLVRQMKNRNYMRVRLNLRIAIVRAGWTQRGLARELGISQFHLSRVVTGKEFGGKRLRARIAIVLKASERFLFRESVSAVCGRRKDAGVGHTLEAAGESDRRNQF